MSEPARNRRVPDRVWCSGVAVLFAWVLPLTVTAQSLPDPTEPTAMTGKPSAGVSATARWTLESTLVADDRRVATINGKTIGVGDTVGGARVMRIEPYSVRIRTAGGIIELTLSDGDPKQVAQGGPR